MPLSAVKHVTELMTLKKNYNKQKEIKEKNTLDNNLSKIIFCIDAHTDSFPKPSIREACLIRSGLQFLLDYWLNNEGYEEIKDVLLSQIDLDEFDYRLKHFFHSPEHPNTITAEERSEFPSSHWWWF